MFDLVVIVRVRQAGDIPAVADAPARMRPLCPADAGCLAREAYASEADPARFVLVERWADRAHGEAHGFGEAIREIYVPELLPRVEREVHPVRPVPPIVAEG